MKMVDWIGECWLCRALLDADDVVETLHRDLATAITGVTYDDDQLAHATCVRGAEKYARALREHESYLRTIARGWAD